MAGAHLHNGNLGAGAYLEHRERNAYLVVQVALGGTYPVGGAQRGLDKLLGGGLAVGAGQADHRNAELPAVVGRQGFEGFQRVGDLDQTGVFGLQILPCHGIGGSLFQGLESKAVAVEVFSLQGKEQLVFPEGTGVRTYACAVQEDIV